MQETDELDAYWRRLWFDNGEALAGALVTASQGRPWQLTPTTARSLAHTVLDTCDLARRSDEPASAVSEIFTLIRRGWPH